MLKRFSNIVRFKNVLHPLVTASILTSNRTSFPLTRKPYTTQPTVMNVSSIVDILESIAPSSTAEDWDNVGLLVQPSLSASVRHIFLTIDLTEPVLNEALHLSDPVGMIVSYHPPIFRPFKRLTQSTAKERIIIKAIESKIAIYSPHTAHDSLWGGVNDWVLKGFDKGTVTPLSTNQLSDSFPTELIISGIPDKVACNELVTQLELAKSTVIPTEDITNNEQTLLLKVPARKSTLNELLPKLLENFPSYKLSVTPTPKALSIGPGRLLAFHGPVPLDKLVSQVKSYLDIPHVRLALPGGMKNESLVSTLAVCVGSGSSLLKGVKADVYLTGEMSHHDVLEATSNGTAVLLCEHTNTERGFLKVFKEMLEAKLAIHSGNVKVSVSEVDKDPVVIM